MYVTKTTPSPKKKPNPSGHVSMTESPLPYRQEDPSETDEPYRAEVEGIMPKYGGHVPRAQHCYGKSACGGIPKMVSPQKKHPDTKQEAGVWAEGKADYSQEVKGIVPKYAGHVPRALHKYGASAYGNVPAFGDGDRTEVAELREMFGHGEDPPSYRRQVNGIVPGYAGHVPRAKDKTGGTVFGSVTKGNPTDTAQANRPDTKAEVPFEPSQRIDGNGVIPGYKGFVPKARDKFGGSTFFGAKGFGEIESSTMKMQGFETTGGVEFG